MQATHHSPLGQQWQECQDRAQSQLGAAAGRQGPLVIPWDRKHRGTILSPKAAPPGRQGQRHVRLPERGSEQAALHSGSTVSGDRAAEDSQQGREAVASHTDNLSVPQGQWDSRRPSLRSRICSGDRGNVCFSQSKTAQHHASISTGRELVPGCHEELKHTSVQCKTKLTLEHCLACGQIQELFFFG